MPCVEQTSFRLIFFFFFFFFASFATSWWQAKDSIGIHALNPGEKECKGLISLPELAGCSLSVTSGTATRNTKGS